MKNIYLRTLKNCKTYEQLKDKKHLLNEIGVLRGVAYCLELKGEKFINTDFLFFMSRQNELLNEKESKIYNYLKEGYCEGLSVILTKLDDLIKAGGGCATITKEDVDALEEEFLESTYTFEDFMFGGIE